MRGNRCREPSRMQQSFEVGCVIHIGILFDMHVCVGVGEQHNCVIGERLGKHNNTKVFSKSGGGFVSVGNMRAVCNNK